MTSPEKEIEIWLIDCISYAVSSLGEASTKEILEKHAQSLKRPRGRPTGPSKPEAATFECAITLLGRSGRKAVREDEPNDKNRQDAERHRRKSAIKHNIPKFRSCMECFEKISVDLGLDTQFVNQDISCDDRDASFEKCIRAIDAHLRK